MAATTPVTWNEPATAKAQLADSLDAAGGVTVIVRIDTNNPHAQNTWAPYRTARFAPGTDGGPDYWYDATFGIQLHNSVTGWALPE